MKKTLFISMFSCFLTCTGVQASIPNSTSSGRLIDQISTNLSNEKFSKHILKKVYPSAVYNKEYQSWEDEIFRIDYDLKDIQTSEGEKRYFALNYGTAGYNQELHLYIFKKSLDEWVLENQEYMNSENLTQHPLFKNKNIELLGKAEVVKLGKDTLGFQLDGRDGGSGGEKGDISWVYSVDNKMKIVTGCHNEEWRFEPLSVECEPKINSNLKSTEAFYPIELNYKLVKYKLNDKAQNGSEEWDRKSIGNKKGKVVILFNPKNQTYELPVGFEKISTNTNKLWEYFSNLAASKQKQVNSNQIDLTDFVKCHVLGVVECESKEDFLQNMTLLQKRSVKQEIVRRDEIAKEGGEDYHSKDVTILLQNATAFGYPINAIHIIRGYEFGATKVEFADFQSLAEVSKLFPLPEHKNKEKGYFLAVYDFDENGKPSPKVKTIYDKEGKPLPRLSVMGGGCYGGLIFNPKALTISDEGGC
ncbi:hypothetical protein [Haemophilus parainfluenzae]|uniref:hypothetical protein n=1 Tax=Haemophilus parainfluenzae TaxID=729 RepID=UPI001E61E2D7|nr:hypothetical protein [Haemophilus parainfluenzae]